MCIKPGQNLKMHGRLGDHNNGFKGFRIYTNRCNPEKNECYELDVINKKLSNVKFNFLILEYGINHYSTNNSNVYYEVKADGRSFSTLFMKKFYYSYSNGHYLIDNPIIWNSVNKITFYKYSSSYMNLDSSSYNSLSSEPSLGYFAFNSDNNVIQYQKYYLKLSSTFSNVGGCINIIFLPLRNF